MSTHDLVNIEQAVALLADGKPAEADVALEQILAREPDSVDALHFLGMARAQQGRTEEALSLVGRALLMRPDLAALHCSLGNILRLVGSNDEAEAEYKLALKADPQHLEGYANLGHLFTEANRNEEAIAPFQQAINLGSQEQQVFLSLATVYTRLERNEELETYFLEVLARSPSAEICSRLGHVLLALRRNEAAAKCLRAALEKRPDDAVDLCGLGSACREMFLLNEAAECLQKAIDLDPDNPDYYMLMGAVLMDFRRPEAALDAFETAIRFAPDKLEVYCSISVAYSAMNRFEEAEAAARKVIAVIPDSVNAINGLGVALCNQNRPREALDQLAVAERIAPTDVGVRFGRGLAHLTLGEYKPGFELLEERWNTGRAPGVKAKYTLPAEFGTRAQRLSDLDGKRVLIVHEQGAGDTLQLIRYAKPLKDRAQGILFCGPQYLIRLLKELPELDEVLVHTKPMLPMPEFDIYTPMMSLPRLFGTTLETIPVEVPYLKVNEGTLTSWRQRLAHLPGRRIGIVWSGNPEHGNDYNRSMSLGTLKPLFNLPNTSFVSLQKDVRETDRHMVEQLGLHQFGEEMRDFADAAAMCACMDLIITVDTAMAHLAGGLGKPVWVLLPWNADWRWLLDREDSPWYPTVRLFRQPKIEDWHSVVQRVRKELGPPKSGLGRLFRR